ncbi:MAG: AarF/ABC1/UbiB kinase family protein [Candidatus Saccharibacteria bacterium]
MSKKIKSEPTINALKRDRTKRLARLGAKVYVMRNRGKEQEMYNLVCDEFVDLGGVYVKFLQGVLFSTPIMKRWHSPNRLKIFENLESEQLDVIAILQQELTPEQLGQIALIQPEPFAAGSFGQVYLGQHVNGKRVIIKILRPMIRELLRYDLRLLSMFSKRFAAKQYDNITIKMNTAIKEFRQATLSETDYIAEAQFAHELYVAYQNNPHLVIPETYMDLCTPHIIVQEYLDGISGAELLRLKESHGVNIFEYVHEKLGSNLELQLEKLGTELLAGAFDLPRIQGDPHPGNIRFLPNDQVGLIDFGISAPSPRNKAAFYGLLNEWGQMYGQHGSVGNMFEQFMRFFVNDLYRALKKLSTFIPGMQQMSSTPSRASTSVGGFATQAATKSNSAADNDLMKAVGHIVQNMFDSALGTRDMEQILDDGRMLSAFSQMVNKGNRLGLVVHLESSEVLRAAQTYISLLETMGCMRQVLPRILEDVTTRVRRDHPEIATETERMPSTSQAVDVVNRWLERVAVKDPMLFRQLLQRIDIKKAMNKAKEKPSDA